MNHLIDLTDIKKQEWEAVVDLALKIAEAPQAYASECKGKILATLFYEPSTRTQMSFQTAMLRLGGNVIGFDNPQNSSVSKGESLGDTVKIVNNYADIIVMRHPYDGASFAAAQHTDKVFINAGDGSHLHPTQTLTDIVTIKKEIGRFDNLTIGFCGDLKYGRTVHSLINLLVNYNNIHFVLISTKELMLPDKFKNLITQNGHSLEEDFSLENAIGKLDILYMTRIQKERFTDEKLYNEQKDIYVLDLKKLSLAKKDLKVLHPLPRVDEISPEVDDDPRACYFMQAKYGMYARMALIITLLKKSEELSKTKGESYNKPCSNPLCITNKEPHINPSYLKIEGNAYCEYCDTPCK